MKYRLSQNQLPVSLWKCENQVRDPKLGPETYLVDKFCDFHFWPSVYVRVPNNSLCKCAPKCVLRFEEETPIVNFEKLQVALHSRFNSLLVY